MAAAVKIKPQELTATWVIEKERAGCNALIGTKVKIDYQQINPMIRKPVITVADGTGTNDKFMQVFGKVKPFVVAITGDLLLCSMGIMARKQTA